MFQHKDRKLLLAVAAVAIIWGTTFLGIRVAVRTIPPWYVAGIRQTLAALILLPVLLRKKELRLLGKKDFMAQIILSSLMLICANGLTTVAEKSLSSSLASLISSTTPLLVFAGSLLFGMQKFSMRALGGVCLGFGGILLIFWDGLGHLSDPGYRLGIIAMIFGVTGWAAGTIYGKTLHKKSQNLFLNLFYQFAFAGIVQILFGLLFHKDTTVALWSWQSCAAVVYLSVFGSVLAYFAFNYLLKRLPPTEVSILSYVNTVIAIFLGWLVLHEAVSWRFLMAAAMIITGVFFTNTSTGKAAANGET